MIVHVYKRQRMTGYFLFCNLKNSPVLLFLFIARTCIFTRAPFV